MLNVHFNLVEAKYDILMHRQENTLYLIIFLCNRNATCVLEGDRQEVRMQKEVEAVTKRDCVHTYNRSVTITTLSWRYAGGYH